MKIAVIGSGAIGGLVAGYLKEKGEDVVLIGHADGIRPVKENGLGISGVRGNFNVKLDVAEKLTFKPDLAILTVKTQDLDAAIKDNLGFLKVCTVLTTQNGVQADNLAAKYILPQNLVSGIVMFGATYLEAGKIVHNFEGGWIIGKISGETADEKLALLQGVLNKIFPAVIADDIRGMKYLKIFVNANNCIPAILGLSMQEAFKDLQVSRISIRIWKEDLEVIKKSGIKLVSLPDFPLERLTKLAALADTEAAEIFSGIMVNLSKEPLYGSILQSIKRKRPSEIDYINGEFVTLAKANGFNAPLNQRLIELVHKVEKSGNFLSKEDLLSATSEVLN
ncbi:MAG: ketopantoate reductase family protein [Candidatus Omnitrophica bacterium]|nr:ketopantoate reductase family protein [Candidatus Omnitrophota bacterium]